jgi:hypothetical protein
MEFPTPIGMHCPCLPPCLPYSYLWRAKGSADYGIGNKPPDSARP